MPLREQAGYVVEAGELKLAPRYSAIERVLFDGVGECEAWQENFMPWLLDLPTLKGLQTGTQKTIRWPGYAAKVTVLATGFRSLGLSMAGASRGSRSGRGRLSAADGHYKTGIDRVGVEARSRCVSRRVGRVGSPV